MPRKEGPPIEERMQRAKELFEAKRLQKQQKLKELYASRIYKNSRITSIVFLWIAQFLLIDWALPFRQEHDKISGGHFSSNSMPTRGVTGVAYYRLTELYIETYSHKKFIVDFPEEALEPALDDSMIVYKSFLLNDYKKIYVPRIEQSYLVTTAVTYKFLPFLLIISGLAAMFIFVKNIEVKSFAWLVFIFTVLGGIFAVYFTVAAYQ